MVGVHQHVGNYPGVTVEKKVGRMDYAGRRFEVIDLPGLYSLAPRSRDEMVAVDVLLGRFDGEPVDAVVCIVDAGNLCRNFYLASQVLELGRPTVVAVNMLDIAERRGVKLDLDRLERQLGVPVVGIQANRGVGLDALKVALCRALEAGPVAVDGLFPEAFDREAASLAPLLKQCGMPKCRCGHHTPSLARRLLLDVGGYMQQALHSEGHREIGPALASARDRLQGEGIGIPSIEPQARFAWACRVLDGVVTSPAAHVANASDRLDRWLTHRVWGSLVFAVVMLAMFQAVFVWAEPAMNAIKAATGAVGAIVEARMAEGALRSLVVDGVIGGVGGVIIFLPQIAILFLFIAILEDCGYMARAAYLMDRVMVRVGLSGKSFIPMLSSFACAVPGIMAARVIEDERDRLTTILVAPLLTCSARLPVYALLIAAFIPDERYLFGTVGLQGLTLAGLYLLGIVAAVVVALILKRTILRGETPPLLLELPSYKRPSLRTIGHRVLQRAWIFVRTAGTLILAVSILIWAALYYPHNTPTAQPLEAEAEQLEARLAELSEDSPEQVEVRDRLSEVRRGVAVEYQRHSYLGHLGRWIEPVVRPLGWDWRIGCAVLASFPAREVVVATMGVMYNLGDLEEAAEDEPEHVGQQLRAITWDGTDRPVFNVPVALSIMVFFALCAQCAATLAVMWRETRSWRWPAFAFTYMTTLAYLGALATYQFGMWISS
jgi:ferrous iron transport protein B